MEKVVYVLGAGFSAPLGLPVMSTFLEKSKEIYTANPEKHGHFKKVFDVIRELSFIKNYYASDLFNIEEILSILEMRDRLSNNHETQAVEQYIVDVINYFTPPIKKLDTPLPLGNWYDFIWGDTTNNPIQKWYGYFVACLLNLEVSRQKFVNGEPDYSFKRNSEAQTQYGIISLNYDLVIENYIDCLTASLNGKKIALATNTHEYNDGGFPFAKLHGSVSNGQIIPPTWSKNVDKLVSTWELAFKLLSEASHIRIIGYSLPISDSYLKFLFKSAVIYNENLKNIDVLCWDPSGFVRQQYQNFIVSKLRFRDIDVNRYLQSIDNFVQLPVPPDAGLQKLSASTLEAAHAKFFS